MKIIGTRDREILLLEATRDEISQLIGYYYANNPCPTLTPGMEINISDMFNQLYRLSQAKRELESASKTLHSVANLVLVMNPLLENITNTESKEDKED